MLRQNTKKGPGWWPRPAQDQGSDSRCLTQKNRLSAWAGGQQPWELDQSHGCGGRRAGLPPAPGVPCGAEPGSRAVGRGRQARLAWAGSSVHCAVGSEVQRGWPHCRGPAEALRAVHGKGQEAEEQGEAGQAQGGGQGKEGPVLDLAVPEQEQQEQQQGQQQAADFQPGGAWL